MKSATCEYMLGLGGKALDPSGGAAVLLRKIAALGVKVPPAYDQAYPQRVVEAIKRLSSEELVIGGGDSCGANKWTSVAQTIHPRRIAYLFLIQASYWCNTGCPPIPDNVEEAVVFYSSWWLTCGLGVYRPPLAAGNRVTKIRYLYVPHLHPGDDDVTGVQRPILADIRRITAARELASSAPSPE